MNIILIELILVLVAALGLGFWQLYDVNKALKEDRDEERSEGTLSSQAPTAEGDKGREDESGP